MAEYDVYGNRTYGGSASTQGGSRARGTWGGFGSTSSGGQRASGGFGAPIQPGGGRSREAGSFVNQQDDSPGNDSFANVFNSGTTPRPGTPDVPSFAPTTAQVQQNPEQYAGTSFDPTLSIQGNYPTGGATSMPQGSEVVNGMAQYTGSNGPLDTTRFTPTNNQANAWYQQYLPNPGNVSYLQFADGLGRNALNAAGGNWTNGDSIATQQTFLNSPAGQQWLASLRGPR